MGTSSEFRRSDEPGRAQQESGKKGPDEDDREDHQERREVDASRAAGRKQAPERTQDRLRGPVEELHDRVARVGVHPGDDRGDDDEPLNDREDGEAHVQDRAHECAADVHAPDLSPKSSVPIRTSVDPSSTATSKSWLIPMDNSGKGLPKRSASRSRISFNRWKYGRASSGSVVKGGTAMRPRTSR